MLTETAIQDAGLHPFKNNSRLVSEFRGRCGLAQSMAGYAFDDCGLRAKPVATQSLAQYWHGHAALTVETVANHCSELFLVDPTFIQFCEEALPGDDPSPGDFLRQSYVGQGVLNRLLKDGYLRLSPNSAHTYLAAFCRGRKPFSTDAEAFDFLRNPPPHEYHFCFAPGDERYSRSSLKKSGLIITAPDQRKPF